MTAEDFFDIDTTLLSIKPNPANRYLQFFLPEHPLAGQNGMARSLNGVVNFARHVASQKIGRWLTPNEVVIHSDGLRENCAPDNLLVFLRLELAKRSLPSHKEERVQVEQPLRVMICRSRDLLSKSSVGNILKSLRMLAVTATAPRSVPKLPRASPISIFYVLIVTLRRRE
jgi:hypothetical protein